MRILLTCLLLFSLWPAFAEPLQFSTDAEEKRYWSLISELRCLVCQNQSLADSHAELANDLRHEVYRLMTSGKDNQEIILFLVKRYGDFVLYRPPFKRSTWLLWLAPFGLMLIAIVILWLRIRDQKNQPMIELNAEEQQRLDQLLKNETDK